MNFGEFFGPGVSRVRTGGTHLCSRRSQRRITKMGERLGGESASKMIPSIIGEGLTITGNVASKGEI